MIGSKAQILSRGITKFSPNSDSYVVFLSNQVPQDQVNCILRVY